MLLESLRVSISIGVGNDSLNVILGLLVLHVADFHRFMSCSVLSHAGVPVFRVFAVFKFDVFLMLSFDRP